jgi:hypothetical protein
MDDWSWFTWLKANSDILNYIVSFNYDILLEDVLTRIDENFGRPCVRGEAQKDIIIYKPHGSIDFGIDEELWAEAIDFSYTNNTPLVELWTNMYNKISLCELGNLRLSADIVLPSEKNYIKNYPMVNDGLKEIRQRASSIRDFVIVGLSYWTVDRPELDYIVELLPLRTRIHFVGPSVNREWTLNLSRQGRPWQQVTNSNELPDFRAIG